VAYRVGGDFNLKHERTFSLQASTGSVSLQTASIAAE
jgi:hypothetical protein